VAVAVLIAAALALRLAHLDEPLYGDERLLHALVCSPRTRSWR
jgi:hypothetical protein